MTETAGMARQVQSRCVSVRHGLAGYGRRGQPRRVGLGTAWYGWAGSAFRGGVWLGGSRFGEAGRVWFGQSGPVSARPGRARQSCRVRQGTACPGKARLGGSCPGSVGQARSGVGWHVRSRQVTASRGGARPS